MRGSCCSSAYATAAVMPPCSTNGTACKFLHCSGSLYDSRYCDPEPTKNIGCICIGFARNNRNTAELLHIFPQYGARRPGLPFVDRYPFYWLFRLVPIGFSRILPGFFTALGRLLLTIAEWVLPVTMWLCLFVLWPCFFHPDILTFPQHGARCPTCFEIPGLPSVNSDVYTGVSNIGHCKAPCAGRYRAYHADGHQNADLYGPASCTREPLPVFKHFEPCGSDTNNHGPRSARGPPPEPYLTSRGKLIGLTTGR